jgi:hypothetical protein
MLSRERWARVWPAASVAVWLLGVVARCIYVLRLHHPRHYVITDARQLVDLAQKLIDAPASQVAFDTIWPPGTSAILAVLLSRDPTGGVAAGVQLLLSCLLPLLVGHTAWMIGGRKLAALALVFASLHPGFIHSAGFFLSEQFFQFAIGLAMWTSVAVVAWERDSDQGGNRLQRVQWVLARCALGFAVGTTWGLATNFRPNALPVAVLVGIGLTVHWWRARRRAALSLLAGGLAGLVLIIAPLTHRCSVLNDSGFCPVSNNIAMNVALGQLDEAAGLEFFDPANPDLDSSWSPPALIQHGYAGTLRVPFSIYDVRAIAGWVWQRIAVDPERFALRVARNVIDLFRVDSWPPNFGPVPAPAHQIVGWLFFGGVVIPGLIGLRRAWRERGSTSTTPLLLCLVMLAVVVVAALSLGEPRYRYPFDGVLIIFAGAVLLRIAPADRPPAPRRRGVAVGVGGAASVALATAAVVAVVSHPAADAPQTARSEQEMAPIEAPALRRDAGELARAVAAGSPFDAPGNHRFDCDVTCTELRLTFPRIQQAAAVEVSLDDNDRYRVTFYRDDVAVSHVDVPRQQRGGMRVATINVPTAAAAAGYDAIGVLPLYGDRFYALGHLRLLR